MSIILSWICRLDLMLIKDKVLECINRFEQQNKNEE